MGAIVKFIIIFLVVSYLIRKVGGFFLKVLFGSKATAGQPFNSFRSSQSQNTRGAKNPGKIYVSKRPDHDDNEPHVKGGEYVDFEEVKD